MSDVGKLLLVVGLAIAMVGAAVWGLARLGFRGMPGDISYQGEHVRVDFPIVTCLVLSLVLTMGVFLWRWFSQGR